MADSKKLTFSKPPILKKFSPKFENWGELKISVFLSWPFWIFFAPFPLKSVNIYIVARMGRNFDDCPGLQQKSVRNNLHVTQCK